MRLLDRRPGEAAAHLETALAINPRFLRARLVLGLVRLQQRHAAEAVEELEAARELEPTYPDVRAWLGLARLAAGDARGALVALERAIALRRTFARAHRHLALVHHALGFSAEARRAALRGWVRDTEVPAFPERPALAGLEAEAADEDQLRRAVAIRPRSPDLHLALGRRLGDRGDHGEARAAFRAALANRPGYPAATLELARAEIARSRLRDAESLLTGLVGAKPSWVDAQALLGRTRLEMGDPRGALAPLRAAMRQRPGLEPARSDLAWATSSQGRAEPPARRRSEAAA
jgi:tetratricopeptide (TPR) repeat protein